MGIIKSIFISASLLLAFVGCGSEQSADEKYYEYDIVDSYRGCRTGYFAFKSKKKFCNHLVQDEKNKSCAATQRRAVYEKNCDGEWLHVHPYKNNIPYYYEFFDNERSCTTGYKTFDNIDDFCFDLKNEKKNKNCAPAQRNRLYEQYCN